MRPELEDQLPVLIAAYGAPTRINAMLPTIAFEPVSATDRVGEVCMVIQRADGSLLTAIKTFYPPSAHRLLTGGISPGESILDALQREVGEETGLDVIISRFLVIVDYYGPDGGLAFSTLAFLLTEVGGNLACHDPAEQHASFHALRPDELLAHADHLATISSTFSGPGCTNWPAWGYFRAITHRAVAAELMKAHN